MGIADEGKESPFLPGASKRRDKAPGEGPPAKDAADVLLRKLARAALVNRQPDERGKAAEGPENPAGQMARRLLQLNYLALMKSRQSRDGRPTVPS